MIGCQPSQSAVMTESVKAGKILDLPSGDTLSDGTSGGIEENSVRNKYGYVFRKIETSDTFCTYICAYV